MVRWGGPAAAADSAALQGADSAALPHIQVSDPQLAAHLAHWGINTQVMEKTEKSMTELQIAANENLQLDKITEVPARIA